MAWARFDDRFHGNPKVMGVWQTCPEAIGLYVMSVTYCSQHETDGLVHDWFLQTLQPIKSKRQRLTSALLNAGMFAEHEAGYMINDYLEFNPSHADLEAKREEAKTRRARARTAKRTSTETSRSHHATSSVFDPDPTRPDPTRGSSDETSLEISPLEVGGVQHQVIDRAGSLEVLEGGAA
jgi:hypothetical protein